MLHWSAMVYATMRPTMKTATMMVVQWHLQYLENIVIPHPLAKSLQATISSFILTLILLALEQDSNWNTMQHVRIHTKYILVHFVSIHSLTIAIIYELIYYTNGHFLGMTDFHVYIKNAMPTYYINKFFMAFIL